MVNSFWLSEKILFFNPSINEIIYLWPMFGGFENSKFFITFPNSNWNSTKVKTEGFSVTTLFFFLFGLLIFISIIGQNFMHYMTVTGRSRVLVLLLFIHRKKRKYVTFIKELTKKMWQYFIIYMDVECYIGRLLYWTFNFVWSQICPTSRLNFLKKVL